MWHRSDNTRLSTLLLVLVLALGLTLTGCSDDDDDNDNPTGPGGATEFDEDFAVQQSQFLVTSVISQMGNLESFAGGISPKADDIYTWGWVDDPGRWEGSYSGTYEGFTSSFSVWLQYLDVLGDPQQEPLGAASMAYHLESTMSGSESGEGYSYSLDFEYLQNYSVVGLGTDELLANGDGTTSIDYSYNSDGNSGTASYGVSWEILSPGIVIPVGGCPTGTMELTMAPFTVTVVFDGTDTATYTMRNGSTIIPSGSGTQYLGCGMVGK